MKQILIHKPGGPEVLQLVHAVEPTPRTNEVLVRAEAIGVGRPDVLIRTGTYKWMPPLPVSPGSELAGRIVALGPGVDRTMLGRACLVSAREFPARGGCYTEMIAVRADDLFLLPNEISLEKAACLGNFQVALALLSDAVYGGKPRSVLIYGAAGGVGSAAVQIARAFGATVIGLVSSREKARFAEQQGAHETINYRQEKIAERVRKMTNGRGVDLICDHVAGPDFTENLALLAPWGMVVSIGAQDNFPEKDLFREMRARATNSPAVRCFSMHVYDSDRTSRRRLMDEAIRLLGSGTIDPPVAAKFPLASAADAHRMLEAGTALGRILLIP